MDEIDRYAVRRTAKDTETQLGLFRKLPNAQRLADGNLGYKVYDTEDGNKLIYSPKLTKAEALVGALLWMERVLQLEKAKGLVWRYSNGALKKESTFSKARSTGLRNLNCVDGVQFGIKLAGITTNDGLAWYGSYGGFRWLRKDSEARARKYFNIIKFDMKPKKAIKYGLLKPGDICSYYKMSHTNCYLGGDKGDLFYDAGRGSCSPVKEKAPFVSWLRRVPTNQKMGLILRPINGQYRVQCGVFESKLRANSRLNEVKKAGFDVMLERDGKEYVVQTGIFDIEANAIALSKKIDEAGIPVLVKEI